MKPTLANAVQKEKRKKRRKGGKEEGRGGRNGESEGRINQGRDEQKT